MPDTARRYTVDEVLAFPSDGNRYELVDDERPEIVTDVLRWRVAAAGEELEIVGRDLQRPRPELLPPPSSLLPGVRGGEGRSPLIEWGE